MKRLLVVLFLAAAATTPATAQIPQTFENLKVLPRDIPRDSLLALMRSFSFALGVRCVHCHVGEDSPTLAGVDFDADDRLPKRKAREMLKMVANINQTLATLPERGDAPINVRCATCHRGIPRPIALEDTLYRVASARGGAAALVAYDSLRAAYFGRASYDFGFSPLIRLSERLYAEKKHADALPLLDRNAELFPRFWNTYYEKGRHLEQMSRREEAIAAYRATLERLPNHQPSLNRIAALGG